MESIGNILESKEKRISGPAYRWQQLALDILAFLTDGDNKRGSIFNCCKKDERSAQIAFNECKELEKPYVLYFLKVFNNIRKEK